MDFGTLMPRLAFLSMFLAMNKAWGGGMRLLGCTRAVLLNFPEHRVCTGALL